LLRRLFKESLVYGLSRYIGKFIGVFLLPLYTAVLKPEDYGILDLLATIQLVSAFLIVSGTDAALSYYYFRKEFSDQRPIMISSALWIRIIFSFVIIIIISFGSGFISNLMFGSDYKLFIWITAITILFNSVFSFLSDLLRFELRPWLFTIVATGSILLNILLTIYFVLILKQGVYGALMAAAFAYGTFFIYTVIYVFKKYGAGFSKQWMKDILSYGFPLIGTGIAVWVLTSTDRYFLAHYIDISSVGIYAVGMKLASFLGLVAGAVQLAWGPFAMDIQDHPNAKKIYSKVFVLFSVVNILGVFLISIFSIDILKVFTQPEYYSAKVVVPFLCMSTVLNSAYFIVAIGINLTKKLQHTIWITISAALLNIGLNFLLIPDYGVIGAAFCLMIANLTIFLLTFFISQKYYPINFRFGIILLILIPSALIIAASYYFELKIFARIIITVIYIAITSTYLYHSIKHSNEFRNLLAKVRGMREKRN